MTKLKIKRGDNVIVTTGRKEIKGKVGEVIEIIKDKNRAVVAGLNIVKNTLNHLHKILREESWKKKLLSTFLT